MQICMSTLAFYCIMILPGTDDVHQHLENEREYRVLWSVTCATGNATQTQSLDLNTYDPNLKSVLLGNTKDEDTASQNVLWASQPPDMASVRAKDGSRTSIGVLVRVSLWCSQNGSSRGPDSCYRHGLVNLTQALHVNDQFATNTWYWVDKCIIIQPYNE
ncbi:hypothetical protein KVV02_003557 [Mortierella alpina]|uniref:Uncharacterized protein n=1 Tax=Mortierella alpina TaxID=64518 RepID=A0A9P8A966_MORAP|nr:hypothetical protein KVV02_003557 [Mortierella alpina]